MKRISWILSLGLLFPLVTAAETNAPSSVIQTDSLRIKGAFPGISEADFLKIFPGIIPEMNDHPLVKIYFVEQPDTPPGMIICTFYRSNLVRMAASYSAQDLEKTGGLEPIRQRLLAKLGPPLTEDVHKGQRDADGTLTLGDSLWKSAATDIQCTFGAYAHSLKGTNALVSVQLIGLRKEMDALLKASRKPADASPAPAKPADVGF